MISASQSPAVSDQLDSEQEGVLNFVVRTPSCWFLARPGAVGSAVDIEVVTSLAAQSTPDNREHLRFAKAAAPRVDQPLTLSTVVAPVWMWVGLASQGLIYIEDVHGSALGLSETDLRLLDALSEPITVRALADRISLDSPDAAFRIARLVAAGRIRVPAEHGRIDEEPEQQGETAPTESAAEHSVHQSVADRLSSAYRLSSKLRPLRRAISNLADHTPILGPETVDQISDRPNHVATNAPSGVRGEQPGRPASPVSETVTGEASANPRTVVYAPWHTDPGPQLSLGMLTAYARAYNDGSLNSFFEIRRPESAASFLQDLRSRNGPAVLLCSNYVWSLSNNIEMARAAVESRPELLVIHGGPSSPKYEADARRFLQDHAEIAHILVRGEGEHVLASILDSLRGNPHPLRATGLQDISGLTYTDAASGQFIRTADQDRISDLDELPSPYLTGEFDHIESSAWAVNIVLETNRGCPYGCAFCDWGSATLSRIRKFSLERVEAEILAAAKITSGPSLLLADANFGIMSRDVEVAEIVARVRAQTGWPENVVITPAKNTTKHLTRILDILAESGVTPHAGLSLQTTDDKTLANINRSNISKEHFVKLAAEVRKRGHPVMGDLMIGLPGQSVDSYLADLQFMLDHEIQQRTWPTTLLPNSPMNDPEYRSDFGLTTDPMGLIDSSTTFNADDLLRMGRLRRMDALSERLGIHRHVMRFLQWEHDLPASQFMKQLLDLAELKPKQYPLWAFVLNRYDSYPSPPVGWGAFYEELRHIVRNELHVDINNELETVLQVQEFLMPSPGRSFPSTLSMGHDYATYYHDSRAHLGAGGLPLKSSRRLKDYPPAELTILDDPLNVCDAGLDFMKYYDGLEEFYMGHHAANELRSPLMRPLIPVTSNGIEQVAPSWDDVRGSSELSVAGQTEEPGHTDPVPVPVVLAPGRS